MSDHDVISLCVAVGVVAWFIGFIIGLMIDDRIAVRQIIEKGETLMTGDYKIVGHVERRLCDGTWSKDV